ncbi:MAG: ATP-dependent DNA helicase Hel308 [Metallosphaera javensis (ex Sakai et al. 2022)]|nr:MAG: ATP-dependent DNA helicase Hel308 [Metallosphaera javensis (ex Sakai et al. 2022)]
MISLAKQISDEEVFGLLRPYVAQWFREKYGSFTPPQKASIPTIKANENVLISSPTGSGKTMAAFVGILDSLLELAEKNALEDKVYAVYISPLRALNNDMYKNLFLPLEEIKTKVSLPQEIRIGVRTSDTSPNEKQKMLRRPPHILITTPESFAISLVSPKFSQRLKDVRWVVVDEIHELAGSKRGAYLSGFLELFESFLSNTPPVRIGLSATISPLEEVAKFLVGDRDCKIVDARFLKGMDLRVISPVRDLIHSSEEEVSRGIYRTIMDEIKKHRTTLIFTNTRSAAERVSYRIRKMVEEEKLFDADLVGAHHSSLSRDVRLEIENKLKNGELKVVVSSTSLELGIDIGYIDLVLLLSSPKSVSRLLQRIGRAGHHIRQISKGRVIVVDRDDLVECAILTKLAREKKIDNVHIPRKPLDVLVQLVLASSLMAEQDVERLYSAIKRSYSFSNLTREEFDSVVDYLLGKFGLDSRNVYPKIRLGDKGIRPKRGGRMIFYLNSGTIPEESLIPVFTEGNKYVGNLEEEFVEILSPGDIFILGGRTYEFLLSKGNRVLVKPAEGQRPTVPSWFSEMLPLAIESAIEISSFRGRIARMIGEGKSQEEIVTYIENFLDISKSAARSIYTYILEEYLFTDGNVPDDKNLLIEIYDDEEDRRNFIFHALFGRRALDALSRIVAWKLGSDLNMDVRTSITDNGFVLTIGEKKDYDIAKAIAEINPNDVYDLLGNIVLRTEMVKRRFRHTAERSLMLLKRYKGRETSIDRRQLNSEVLMNVVKEIPNFPVLKETLREILEDYMDIHSAKWILERIAKGDIKLTVIGPNPIPSPFAHQILAKEYSDIVLASDKREFLRKMHDKVLQFLREKGIDVDLSYTTVSE